MNTFEKARQTAQRADDTQPAPQVALRHLIFGIICSVLFTVVFVRLFDFVEDHGRTTSSFDRSILYWMYHHRADWLTQTAKILARLGSRR